MMMMSERAAVRKRWRSVESVVLRGQAGCGCLGESGLGMRRWVVAWGAQVVVVWFGAVKSGSGARCLLGSARRVIGFVLPQEHIVLLALPGLPCARVANSHPA